MVQMDEAQQKAFTAQNKRRDELVAQGYSRKHAIEAAQRDFPTPAQRKTRQPRRPKS